MKRSTIKRKRSKYPSAAQLEERRTWASAYDRCWICGEGDRESHFDGVRLQVHEIASRAQAPNRWADFRNYFVCCGRCNTHVLNHLPEALQLAYKRKFDPGNYDRVLVNRLRGRADDAISECEVRAWSDFVKAIT